MGALVWTAVDVAVAEVDDRAEPTEPEVTMTEHSVHDHFTSHEPYPDPTAASYRTR